MRGRTVVTGAAGFIGRNVVAELNRRGSDDVILVDDLGSDDKWKNLRGLAFEDILSPVQFRKRLHRGSFGRSVGAIVHLGACSATTESDADYLLANNYGYTRRLCEWALERRVRFVYASSAATYGDGSRSYSDDDAVTPALVPMNMYGYSKHMFDLWALRSGALDQIVGLKYFNVFGPGEAHKGDMRSVVAKAYDEIGRTGTLSLFRSYRDGVADGEQMRDFVYVADAVDVTLHFLEDTRVGGLYNCGTGQARTWLDLGRAVFAALGREPRIDFIEMPASLRDRYQYFTQAEVGKLRASGYDQPFTSLEDAVAQYVQQLADDPQ